NQQNKNLNTKSRLGDSPRCCLMVHNKN
ncbi:hypothetical protein CWATWH0003_2529b4, partial [Crocosphaera watsonii WH 0003]